jgi:hypothetical protein
MDSGLRRNDRAAFAEAFLRVLGALGERNNPAPLAIIASLRTGERGPALFSPLTWRSWREKCLRIRAVHRKLAAPAQGQNANRPLRLSPSAPTMPRQNNTRVSP